MKRLTKTAIFLCSLYLICSIGYAQDLTKYVNKFMGVKGNGNCVIGPQLPFGSINPSPDTPDGYTDGYSYVQPIRGFSQLHVSGTGGPGKYGNILISPQIGLNVGEEAHDSPKDDETSSVSSYNVLLTRYNIHCGVTPVRNSALYRFRFPKSDSANILIDLSHNVPQNCTFFKSGHIDQGEVSVIPSENAIKGWGYYWGGWSASPMFVYFYISFNTPVNRFGTWHNDTVYANRPYTHVTNFNDRLGAYIGFSTKEDQEILAKIGISFVSTDQAKRFLDNEIPSWDFQAVEDNAAKVWNNKLGRIEVEGGTEEQKNLFYTCLYNTMRMPRDRTGDNPHWNSDQPYWDDQYCIWDTWRTDFPLQVIINESMVRDNVKAFIDRLKYNGQVQDAFIAGHDRSFEWDENERINYFGNQGGDNVDNVIADAYVKGVSGVNWVEAYKILKFNADYVRAPFYRMGDKGWMPYGACDISFECSRTLEFAYNDFCAATMAKGLGYKDDYEKYISRCSKWPKLWNPDTESDGYKGFIMPLLENGVWAINNPKTFHAAPKGYYYEGTGWIYSYFVPHDVAKLIELNGGKEMFVKKLNHAIEAKLIDYGNEPSFLAPWLFIYAGRPDLSAYWVRQNIKNYKTDAFPGDEDSGAMGSWFVFSNMGFFPNAGQDIYFLNGPLFKKVKVHMENGKTIEIEGINVSDENIYVQSATLNGKPLERAWIRHAEIRDGAELIFVMGPKPSNWGNASVPPSLSTGLYNK